MEIFTFHKKWFLCRCGAAHPTKKSVTKYFYDHGWSGINIDPRQDIMELYTKLRPRDINYCCAVSNERSLKKFYLRETLSTFDEDTVNRLGREHFTESYIQTRTLDDIINESKISDIHFLKIDAEKHEKNVLEGCNLAQHQPWVLAIESTLPLTRIESHEEWEDYVLTAGYSFATKFAANRYYVLNKYKDVLLSNFMAKPCVYFMRRKYINYIKKVFYGKNIPFFRK